MSVNYHFEKRDFDFDWSSFCDPGFLSCYSRCTPRLDLTEAVVATPASPGRIASLASCRTGAVRRSGALTTRISFCLVLRCSSFCFSQVGASSGASLPLQFFFGFAECCTKNGVTNYTRMMRHVVKTKRPGCIQHYTTFR